MRNILIVAGEPSGDLHASFVLEHLKKADPSLCLFSAAGKRSAIHSKQIYDLAGIAAMGLVEVIRYLPAYCKAAAVIERFIKTGSPDIVILVDFPDFNLRLARKVKKLSPRTKVVYYISPQVWAWRKSRIDIIRRYIDHMLVIFKFEEDFYRDHGIPATFVGHPLLEIVQTTPLAQNLREKYAQALPITLMPGSRFKVVSRHLPLFLESARHIHAALPQTCFFIIKPGNLPKALYLDHLKKYSFPAEIIEENRYDYIRASRFVLTSSGTATIEIGILGTPFAIIYRMNPLSFFFLKRIVHTPFIGMINIIFQKKIIEEFIQQQATAENIARYCLGMINDPARLKHTADILTRTRTVLGENETSAHTAVKTILGVIL